MNNNVTGEINETTSEVTLVDGHYSVSSKHYDPNGYGLTLTGDVHRGILTRLSLTETNVSGTQRIDNPQYKIPWNGCNLNLSQLYTSLYSSFIHKQSPEIDTISGATQTCADFKLLATTLYEAAKAGTPSASKVDTFAWTYTATALSPEENGYFGHLKIAFEGETITQVTYDEINGTSTKSGLSISSPVYNTFSRQTLTNQTLTPLAVDINYPVESQLYNELLIAIQTQRGNY